MEVPNSSYSQCQVKENHLKCNACSTRRNKAATSTQVIPQSKEGEEMNIHQENAQDVENIHHIVGKNVQQKMLNAESATRKANMQQCAEQRL